MPASIIAAAIAEGVAYGTAAAFGTLAAYNVGAAFASALILGGLSKVLPKKPL